MAVAQFWTVSIGCQAGEEERQIPLGESLPAQHIARRRRKRPAGQLVNALESGSGTI
jgi:hypothetical protein